MTTQTQQPQPSIQTSEKQVVQTSEKADGRPERSTPPPSIETWADLLKSCARVAFAIPFLAFVVAGMGSDQFSELSVSDVKLKTTGLHELASIVMALLMVRFARDASRIFAISGFGSVGLILEASAKAETHIRNDYARPVDLYKAGLGSTYPKLRKRLGQLEKVRSALITTLAWAAAVGVLFAEGKAVWDMFSAPKLAPYLSYSVAIIVCVLLAIAATDVMGILVSRSSTTQRFKRRTEWENKVAACERSLSRLKCPLRLPEPWPPLSTAELDVFISIVKTAHRAQSLHQQWEEHDQLEKVLAEVGGWPPASHFPFQYVIEERQKRQASRQRRYAGHQDFEQPAPAASRSDEDTQEIRKLREEFDEKFRDTAKPIGKLKWHGPIDTSDVDCDVPQYKKKIEDASEILSKWLCQHESIQWCKGEAANPRSPLEIPQFWEEDDIGAVCQIRDQIGLARWQETKSIWSKKRNGWIKVSAVSLVRVRALPTAIKGTFKTLRAHPAPAQAITKIGHILRRQGWKAIRETVREADSVSND
jgi:hypothetical protein